MLPLSSAVSSLLVFINAHLACNYTNRVAVVASHPAVARWLYPSPVEQHPPRKPREKHSAQDPSSAGDDLSVPSKCLKANASNTTSVHGIKLNPKAKPSPPLSHHSSNKYRQFRLVEEELIRNLTDLLSIPHPASATSTTSTMTAGALTLALSYINRERILYSESSSAAPAGTTATTTAISTDSSAAAAGPLASRILLLSTSPSPDLAHQYIPIMNAIFACQRLSIPIDIAQIPLPNQPASGTVFLQQAADATKGIYVPIRLSPPGPQSGTGSNPTPNLTKSSYCHLLLTYLLQSFLPSPPTRTHLVPPTQISVDFRAACFCHRRVVDLGYVCSVCLSTFCAPLDSGECLTCGTRLDVGPGVGRTPVVVRRKKKKKRDRGVSGGGGGTGSGLATPTAAPA